MAPTTAPKPAAPETIRVTREGNGTYELLLKPEWADGEPRARDLDLARWLEFKRPREIRQLIERHRGRIAPMEFRGTVPRNPSDPVSAAVAETSPKGGRPEETRYLLTEREALFIASQSRTPKALDVTQRVIDVFVLARRGQLRATGTATLPGAPPSAPSLPAPPSPDVLQGALARRDKERARDRERNRVRRARDREALALLEGGDALPPQPPATGKRLMDHPHWPELRRYAEVTSRHPVCRGEDFDRAGEWTPPPGTQPTPILVDDLAHLSLMHIAARRG